MDEQLIKSSGIWSLGQLQMAPNQNTQKAQFEGEHVKIKNKEEEHLRSLQKHIWPNSLGLASTRGMSPQKDEVNEKLDSNQFQLSLQINNAK